MVDCLRAPYEALHQTSRFAAPVEKHHYRRKMLKVKVIIRLPLPRTSSIAALSMMSLSPVACPPLEKDITTTFWVQVSTLIREVLTELISMIMT